MLPMRIYDRVELCLLIKSYILHNQHLEIPFIDARLYRNDWVMVSRNLNDQQLDKLRKNLITSFQRMGLQVALESKLNNINLSDINIDLQLDESKHYRKPNEKLCYISKESNDPPLIIKNLISNERKAHIINIS